MIDTHIHLDEEAYAPDREAMIARQKECGVTAMIVPGVNAMSVEGILDLCRRYPGYCYAGLGFHPQDVKADWQEQWAIIEKAIRENRKELVAIGEIGLDYYWDITFKDAQQEVFKRQLALAEELDLPVMIHNREATEDTLKILKEAHVHGVIHCFNGSKETAQQILNMGLYLGIGGVLTFKNCKLSETLEIVPMERIVLETDGPYLAPTPHRGERNESRLMILVAERLAQVYNCSIDTIIAATNANAKRLFGLK
ncbi:MAG: TatD family hydrolase [Paludibacteraceae bacterium]|nr:TatD family hydrolase [Paludibacteraceae bacterium]